MTQQSSADLQAALTFVIERIGQEAERSGAPLDDQERDFLRHLPRQPTNPTAYQGLDPESLSPTIRDFSFETLCALARNARLHDIRTHPEAARDWEFAAAVLQLESHPMSWLLNWSGMKKLRPRWDRLLLIGTALLLVSLMIGGAIALSLLVDYVREVWKKPLFVAGGLSYGLIAILLFLAVQGRERKALRRLVEKGRPRA